MAVPVWKPVRRYPDAVPGAGTPAAVNNPATCCTTSAWNDPGWISVAGHAEQGGPYPIITESSVGDFGFLVMPLELPRLAHVPETGLVLHFGFYRLRICRLEPQVSRQPVDGN